MRRKVQLYVAGRQVDLGDDSFILYNWTREELGNPTAVINSSSHQIQLPGTCRNNGVLGAAFRLDRRTLFGNRYDGTQFDPTRKTPFMLYDNDGTVLESGYCRLDEVNTHNRRHAYTMTLYGGLGSFFYALASKEDGTPRTLADLVWTGDDDEEANFNISPGAAAVNDAWGWLSTGESALGLYHAWNIINFAPCYNGLPDDFDASHALMKAGGLDTYGYTNIPEGKDEDGEHGYEYAYKAGLDCALVSFTNPHTEWELGDLRWYLQRPVVSVKAFIAAICDPDNNGGYEVNLDETFFKDDNPAYADAWWTLPMIATEDRNNVECLKNVLAATKSPMSYLVDYAKHFGLVFLWDTSRHEVSIVTRATFYQQEFGGGNPEEGEETVIPSAYLTRDEGAAYYSASNVSNGYHASNNSTYCQIGLTRGEGAETHFFYKFDFSGIPANAIIRSVAVKATAYISNRTSSIVATRVCAVARGTTDVAAGVNVTGTASPVTINAGTGWTRQNLDDLAIHLHAVRGTSNTTSNYYFRFYGADVTVEYEIPAPSESKPVIDLTKRVDRSQPITIDPVLADRKWYQLGDGGKGEFVEQYKADYGRGYAVQRIDTGYEFDAGTTVLTEGQTFQEAAEVSESDFLFAAAVNNNLRGARFAFTLPRYEKVSIELWNTDGESQSYDITCPEDVNYFDNPDHPFTDWLPKLQLHGADNKGNDGTDTLVFFTGIIDTPSYGSGGYAIRKPYFLTDDDTAMTDLAGGPCWDLTRTSGIQRSSLPSFRRNVLSGPYIVQSWEWGVPAARPVPDIQHPNGAPTALYDMWWKAYLADRYNVDTAVMTCMVDLRGIEVGQELLRRFFWYDNALWMLNAIRNHSLTTWDLTECEFVKVQSKAAYTDGPGSLTSHFLDITPASTSFQVKSRGEILTLTIRSSSAWTLSLSSAVDWLVPSANSGSAGTTVITLTAVGNDSSARRSVNVTVTNSDGISKLFSVIQPPKTAGSLTLDPASLNINSGGTGLRGASSRVIAADNAAWDVDMTTVPSWLRLNKSSAGVTVYCDGNSGSVRSAYIKVFLTEDTDTYAILAVTQEEGASGTGGITLLDGNGNSSATVESTGGTLTLYVTIPEGDDWTIVSSESWATLSAASGTGNGSVVVTIPSYSGSSDRQATITATRDGYSEGAVFYIHQAAPAAAQDEIIIVRYPSNWFYNNVEVNATGGALGATVSASGNWSAALGPNSSWIHPDTQISPWSGGATNNTTIWFDVDANNGAARTGTIVGTCGNATTTFYVYQAGDGSLTISAAFNKESIDASAQDVYLIIQATPGLAWSLDNINSNLTPVRTSGTGSDEIRCSVSANSGTSYRDMSIRVYVNSSLHPTATVRQLAPASSDYLRVTPFGTVNVQAYDTYKNFTIECSTSWQVTTTASGITFSQSSGSGNATVRVNFAANTSSSSRSIPISFATTNGSGLVTPVTIVQGGASAATLSVNPTTVNLPALGTSTGVTVSASDTWFSYQVVDSGHFNIYASENTGMPRTGTVTVTCGDKTVTVTVNQAGSSSLEVSSTTVALGSDVGDSEQITVYASRAWEVNPDTIPAWLTVSYPSHSGSANGETLTFTAAAANTTGSSRSAYIYVRLADDPDTYKEIAVTQASGPYLYVSPTAANAGNGVGTGFIHVSCNTSWEIYDIETGLSIASSAQSGTGDKDVMYAYTANPDGEVRRCRVRFRTTDQSKTAMFTLVQAAATAPIQITPDSDLQFEADNQGSTTQLTRVVRCTAAWTAASSNSWLTFSPSSGAANTDVTVTFTARASLTDILRATWTVISGNNTKSLSAMCTPAPEIE